MNYPIAVKAFRGIRIAVAVLIMRAAVKLFKKMLKKTPNRIISIIFVIVSFGVVFGLDVLDIHFSTIYLILAAGLLGFSIYALPKGGGK